MLKKSDLSVRKSPIHGFGVFADQDIDEGDVIEQCYMLVDDFRGALPNYRYEAKCNQPFSCLPLGYGAIYNHHHEPNASYKLDEQNFIMNISAKRPIKKGEEILIYYGKKWFLQREITPMQTSLSFRVKRYLYRYRYLMRSALVVAALYCLIYLVQ